MSKNGVINLHFLTILTQTLQDTIDFCKKIGLLPNVVTCPNCKKTCKTHTLLTGLKEMVLKSDTSVIKRSVEAEGKGIKYL